MRATACAFRRTLVRAALLGVLALVGSGAAIAERAASVSPGDPVARLFTAGFDDIERLYVEPEPISDIALSGATQLRVLDPLVGVTDHLAGGPRDTLTLLYNDHAAADLPRPAEQDTAGWGEAVAALIATAQRASPHLAALARGQIEDAIFDRIADALDPFSRYVAPAAANTDRAVREGLSGADAEAGQTVAASRDGDILTLRIGGFNRNTMAQVRDALTAAKGQGTLTGVVLDLRGNPGGLLDQAVGLAGLFIERGPIAATVGRIPASDQYFTASGRIAIAPQVRLAVLINGGSASASEIVASALQDNGRAVVIGSSSFGKGTVQAVQTLPNGGELILTWARLITRGGYRLQHHGVVPTLCTALLPETGAPIAVSMQQAAAVAFAAPRPRAVLDDTGWARLRTSCPPRMTRPAIDLTLAERLLGNPALYASALSALPAASP